MIELKPIDWNDFFNTLHLFAPKEFTARLLERSFRQPEGWVELGLVLAIMAASFFIAKQAEKSQRIKNIKFRPIRHSLRRVIFPVIMLMFSVVALLLWRVFGQTGVWLRLLVLAAH